MLPAPRAYFGDGSMPILLPVVISYITVWTFLGGNNCNIIVTIVKTVKTEQNNMTGSESLSESDAIQSTGPK